MLYTAEDIRQLNSKIQYQAAFIDRLRDEVGRVIVGQHHMMDRLLIGLELENVPQAQIAVILGLSEANTRVRLHRIRDKIKQKFKSYGDNR